jgi:hypothetical protein
MISWNFSGTGNIHFKPDREVSISTHEMYVRLLTSF